jgi:hypothetical protein
MTRTRAAVIQETGFVQRDSAGAYVQADDLTPASGVASSTQLPLQVTLAITLDSAFPGPTGRGRFFIPSPALGVLVSGSLSASSQTSISDFAQAYCNAINVAAAANGAGRLCVASGGSVLKGIAPGLRTVVQIRVGRVPDTIRDRRGDLPELYVARPLTA